MNKKMMTSGLVLALAVTAHAQQEQAQQILKETGVTGGLVVVLGCGDGELTAALRAGEAFIVQGLDRDPGKVAAVKQRFIDAKLGAAVTARQFTGNRLPYAEEMVSLLVVSDDLGVARAEMERVLVPVGEQAPSRNPLGNRQLRSG